ncbi:MAG: antibiotic biosynthesis monooxygenase [Solirubrobacterales bacterium]
MSEPDSTISRYGKATAQPGKGEELAAILVEAARQNENVAGCVQYAVNQYALDPDIIWVTEMWADQASIDASLSSEETRALIDRARPLIKDMEMVELVPLGGLRSRQADLESRTAKSGLTSINLEDVKDQAADFGFGEFQESRFANDDLELTQAGLSFHRIKPDQRQPFGHNHESSEEAYVVIGGSGRAMVGDQLIELKKYDTIRVGPNLIRSFEADSEGLELLAVGQRLENDPGEVFDGWWGSGTGS